MESKVGFVYDLITISQFTPFFSPASSVENSRRLIEIPDMYVPSAANTRNTYQVTRSHHFQPELAAPLGDDLKKKNKALEVKETTVKAKKSTMESWNC